MYRATNILRILLGIIFISHSLMRMKDGTVGGFGEFLGSNHLPLGSVLAWIITLFELLGGIALIVDYRKKWIAVGFMIEIAVGIILVHAKHGWFVVGHSTGGIEYSLVLLASLWVVRNSD